MVGSISRANRKDSRATVRGHSPHVQNELVSALDVELVLVSGNGELVERMQGKIQAAIGRVWGYGDSVQR